MGTLGRVCGDPVPLKGAGRDRVRGTRRPLPFAVSTTITIHTLEGGKDGSRVTVIARVHGVGADNS